MKNEVNTRRVVLYGSDLVVSTIGASLRNRPEFQVQEIERLLPDTLGKLHASPPGVILFDMASAWPEFAITLLRRHPKIMLIGVDIAGSRMLVLSGEPSQLLTIDDLVQMIERGVR